MAEQIKIRTHQQGDVTEIRVLMQHPMETGQRKNDQGQTVPLLCIRTFTLMLNGKLMLEGQLNTSVSKNPLFTFKAKGVKTGDKLSVAWVDSSGDKRQDELTVS